MKNNNNHHVLSLKASPSAWRLYSARKADPKFKKFELKVLHRDNHTCQFCGFQANLHQDVINADGDYSHNRLSDMVTACCFCSQCFFLESVGVGGYGGGSLIYLPEMSQAELNSMCHVLFCAITNDTGYKITAQTLYRSFRFRSQLVEDKFGEGTSDPAIFGHLLIDSGALEKNSAPAILNNLRLLPSRAKFRIQIEAWAANALESTVK